LKALLSLWFFDRFSIGEKLSTVVRSVNFVTGLKTLQQAKKNALAAPVRRGAFKTMCPGLFFC
jgi:hypothetical protein